MGKRTGLALFLCLILLSGLPAAATEGTEQPSEPSAAVDPASALADQESSDTASVLPEEPLAAAVVGWRTKPGQVLRTLSLRTVQAWATPGCVDINDGCFPDPVAGRYVTVGPAMRMYESAGGGLRARDESRPLDVNFGVFRAGLGKIKLLGPNGLWVGFDERNGKRYVSAIRSKFDRAARLKVEPVPEYALSDSTRDALNAAGAPLDGLVCLKAFGANNKPLGRLGLINPTRPQPLLRLYANGNCGNFPRGLFHTDLPDDTGVTVAVPTQLQHPLLPVLFVPPNRKATPFATKTEWDAAADLVDTYFDNADLEYNWLLDLAGVQLDNIDKAVSDASILEPPPPTAPEVDTTGTLVGAFASLGGLIPGIGPLFTIAGATYSICSSGIFLGVDEPDPQEPRLLASVQNAVGFKYTELQDQLRDNILEAGEDLAILQDRILGNCDRFDECASHRGLAMWLQVGPRFNRTRARELTEHTVAAFEREAWLQMLATRGRKIVLQAESAGPGCADPQVLRTWYEETENTSRITPYLHASLRCNYDVESELEVWGIGLRNDAGAGETTLNQKWVKRLFARYNEDKPLGTDARPLWGGLEIPRHLVACTLDHKTEDNSWVPTDACHFNYTRANGDHEFADNGAFGPQEWRDRLMHREFNMALWMVDQAQVERGRKALDVDVLPGHETRAAWSGCDAEVTSASSGSAPVLTWLYVLNVTGSSTEAGYDLHVRALDTNGEPVGEVWTVGAEEASRFARPLVTTADTYGPYIPQHVAYIGQAFEVTATGTDGKEHCLGRWTAIHPDDRPGAERTWPQDVYSVAEVHHLVVPNGPIRTALPE